MALKQTLEALEKVAEISTLAGLKGHLDEDALHFVLGVAIDETRRQGVFVRDTTRDPERRIVTVFSPCLAVKKGLFGGLSKEMALDLLRANENMHFARYGIFEGEKETMVVASADHLLDTLDPQEFEAAIFSVALAADMYEKKFGKDEY